MCECIYIYLYVRLYVGTYYSLTLTNRNESHIYNNRINIYMYIYFGMFEIVIIVTIFSALYIVYFLYYLYLRYCVIFNLGKTINYVSLTDDDE